MTVDSAYLLVFHGSHDIRAQLGMQELTNLVLASLNVSLSIPSKYTGNKLLLSKPLLLETACLELAEVSLEERVYQLGLHAIALGLSKIVVLPMLLATGVHVQVDIPREIAIAQSRLGDNLTINISAHLGSYSGIRELIQQQYQGLKEEGKIILAHGSRLEVANQEVEKLAVSVGAIAAYSFISPSLTTQVEQLIQQGKQTITIIPYVLFPGKITDAIAIQVEQLTQQYPQINFYLSNPLGATPFLAQIITNQMQNI